jgi:hypothetical protein
MVRRWPGSRRGTISGPEGNGGDSAAGRKEEVSVPRRREECLSRRCLSRGAGAEQPAAAAAEPVARRDGVQE